MSLSLEVGETVTLSPDSPRFRLAYERVRPRSADEVREIMGLSQRSLEVVQKRGACCGGSTAFATTVAAEQLDAKEPVVRAAARAVTYAAFKAYVHGINPTSLEQFKPAFERYLELGKAVISIVHLLDIEVADGATLNISASTHVVRARKLIIHRTGRIVCHGSTTFKVASVEGQSRRILTAATAIGAVLDTSTHR
jgi:hypothetical protein